MNRQEEIWELCKITIREEVNELAFKTWFEPVKAVALDGDLLTIEVPNRFFYEWLEKHYVDLLRKAIRAVLGTKAKLEYQILMAQQEACAVNRIHRICVHVCDCACMLVCAGVVLHCTRCW